MIDELGRELTARGVDRRRRERILDEIADHLACDPDADLGEPRALAAQFADELAASAARRAAWTAFAALTLVAAALLATQAALPAVPDIASGRSVVLAAVAGLCVFAGAQVAFVAGSLAALRALRLRREPALAAAEVALLRRRTAVALGAGAATAAGIALYALNFWDQVPRWWSLLSVVLAAAAVAPLAAAALAHARAGALAVSVEGQAGGFAADLGPLARPRAIGVAAVAAMLVGASLAERSLVEGVERAAVEAIAFTAGYLALGRPLGLSSDPTGSPRPGAASPSARSPRRRPG